MKILLSERPKRQNGLALIALACFVASLFLPSVKLVIFNTPAIYPGWTTAWSSLYFGASDFKALLAHSPYYFSSFIIGLAALTNIAFFIIPIASLFSRLTPKLIGLCTVIAACGLLLGISAPFCSPFKPTILPGYYLWLAGYIFLLIPPRYVPVQY